MKTERQICVALYKRIPYSFGRNRQIFGYEAYHWGILIVSNEGKDLTCESYDVSDVSELNKTTWRMDNPDMNWFFRAKKPVNPEKSSKFLGHVVIGVDTSGMDFKSFFEQVPTPVKDSHPQQSCVTWVENAIQALQKQGLVRAFDIREFKDHALSYADGRLGERESRKYVHYSELQESS
ncbi:hypothetical protein ACRE_036590 [Hapsidospora chrysogenum ATCC 11550]|uniref:Uncharacterized protein n=1 Tax=Hapsidospora chrysogenum (strain ATCC 11550 / CBS 779.69 / DSM 880 / IAM 14645 / JCM 23072 / IMI 49137) TaxID=857340 RepID=A0A086T845_HAPC1|nr:hypothetical protein ACRE_036590 [Hapsidospora chrysogenum ATCC 11550]